MVQGHSCLKGHSLCAHLIHLLLIETRKDKDHIRANGLRYCIIVAYQMLEHGQEFIARKEFIGTNQSQ